MKRTCIFVLRLLWSPVADNQEPHEYDTKVNDTITHFLTLQAFDVFVPCDPCDKTHLSHLGTHIL